MDRYQTALAIAFLVTSAITRCDIDLTREKRRGELPPDTPVPPKWFALIYYFHWGIGLTLLIQNWKLGVSVFVLRFFLSAFGILEFAGYVMLLPLLSYVSKKNAKAKQARHDDYLEFLKNKEEYLASDWTREEEAEES